MSAVEGPGAGAKPWGGRYRGVTKHKRTQRYEAHIWQCKKQLYLGGFDSEVLAAKSHGEFMEELEEESYMWPLAPSSAVTLQWRVSTAAPSCLSPA